MVDSKYKKRSEEYLLAPINHNKIIRWDKLKKIMKSFTLDEQEHFFQQNFNYFLKNVDNFSTKSMVLENILISLCHLDVKFFNRFDISKVVEKNLINFLKVIKNFSQ
ncbi:MAG: hypothetical protein CMP11_06950, partial [Zetaproteobacteria bacterium]|nr:hypothetical protein [Pseudobdellovibrionaceae bacterium]